MYSFEGKIEEPDELLSTFLECAYSDGPDCQLCDFDDFFSPQEPVFEEPEIFSTLDDFADLYIENSPKQKIGRKRKSEDWDAKPLEKRTDFTYLGKELSCDKAFSEQSDLFVNTLSESPTTPEFKKSPVQKKNNCLNSKLYKKASRKVKNSESKSTNKQNAAALVPKKSTRTRWTAEEVRTLWLGVEEFGNNWCKVRDHFLSNRTYYQVKDKGRRLLTDEGWECAKAKSESKIASDNATRIALRINKQYAFSVRNGIMI